MSAEKSRFKERYNGTAFLADLETKWGGPLFFGIDPRFEDQLGDIRPFAYTAFRKVFDLDAGSKPTIPIPVISGDIVTDFRNHLIASSPHSEEAIDSLHLVADPFCRAYTYERVGMFLQESSKTNADYISFLVDRLPFDLQDISSIVFQTPLYLPSPEAYIDQTKRKAPAFAQQVNLPQEQREEFTRQFTHAMERFKQYVKLVDENKGSDLHPIIQVMCHFTLGDYYFTRSKT